MSNVVDPNSILDKYQVAEVLGISVQTVMRLVKDGTLPKNKVGKKWYCTGRQLIDVVQGPFYGGC